MDGEEEDDDDAGVRRRSVSDCESGESFGMRSTAKPVRETEFLQGRICLSLSIYIKDRALVRQTYDCSLSLPIRHLSYVIGAVARQLIIFSSTQLTDWY